MSPMVIKDGLLALTILTLLDLSSAEWKKRRERDAFYQLLKFYDDTLLFDSKKGRESNPCRGLPEVVANFK